MLIAPADILNLKKTKGFIVFEGVNGAGKSTIISKTNSLLKEKNQQFTNTKEPGGAGKIGQQLREILLESDERKSELTELYLFCADRNHHLNQVVKPAINDNKLVVCDRFYYSTLAFQGYGRGLDLDLIKQIHTPCLEETLPDLVFLLDLPPEIGLERNSSGKDDKDNFEIEKLEFHQRIRIGFLELAKTLPENFILIDANKTADEVWDNVQEVLLNYLGVLNA